MKSCSTRTANCPNIFIAHSLGGTIVSSVLLYADSAQETPTTDLRSIILPSCGAIFIGTPELDSRLIELQSYLDNAKGLSKSPAILIRKHSRW
ncbi:unnamed protein product [Penicillium roqueforti FM164]|uniref:Genomic scaffold, ProqFM164S04 n=1 Tax=Penicillium roqueforti (strain FM164) TaxID=1365484 RepID=W6QGJ1_PENRF|nr:unnamed protein product [Penicillium roqueforti FM164]